MQRRVQVQGRGEEGRGGEEADTALPTQVSECDADGITQRSDIYSLFFSSFFLHFGFTVCVVALNHS